MQRPECVRASDPRVPVLFGHPSSAAKITLFFMRKPLMMGVRRLSVPGVTVSHRSKSCSPSRAQKDTVTGQSLSGYRAVHMDAPAACQRRCTPVDVMIRMKKLANGTMCSELVVERHGHHIFPGRKVCCLVRCKGISQGNTSRKQRCATLSNPVFSQATHTLAFLRITPSSLRSGAAAALKVRVDRCPLR